MARIDPKIMLRLPQELKDKVQAAAKANNRSMNAEIAVRLERTFHEFSQMDDMQLQTVRTFYHALVTSAAEQLARDGLDVGKQDIEDRLKSRTKEIAGRILGVTKEP